jgi:precorrin-6A/cobalt-precorrin-6A reductase
VAARPDDGLQRRGGGAPSELAIESGPFALAEEHHRQEHRAIDVFVRRSIGGAATAAKLPAGRSLNLPVVMVDRPCREPGCAVKTHDAALDWLARAQPSPDAKRVS